MFICFPPSLSSFLSYKICPFTSISSTETLFLCTAVTICHVSHDAAYSDLMKVILKWNVFWLFRLDWYGWKKRMLRVVFWAINLLDPTLAMPIICWMLSTRYSVISQLSIKLWWHLLCCWPPCLRCTTDCHYRHTLSSSTRSIALLFQWLQPYLSVHVCAYEFMSGYYWCVKAAGMLACFRYDTSWVW